MLGGMETVRCGLKRLTKQSPARRKMNESVRLVTSTTTICLNQSFFFFWGGFFLQLAFEPFFQASRVLGGCLTVTSSLDFKSMVAI